ncbi:MAG TPA: peptidogalycan biosysnthesis protein [Burkholderiales bacterium]|nr:peptidogalycan biosysnthesis protein [Burkholderiales bacterium]
MFSVGFVSRAGEIDAALWEACFPPPLEGRWWYETLERSRLEDQFRFLYAVIRDADAPIGIAPLFVMDFPLAVVAPEGLKPLLPLIGALAHPKTLFVGSPFADEGTVGLLPGIERRSALIALQEALIAKAEELDAPLVVWKDVPPSAAEDVAGLAGMFRVESFPGTIAELGGDKAAYLASLKGSRRHNLLKKVRRSVSHLAVRSEILQRPEPRALDEIFPLFMQTYERSSTRFERLPREFFAQIAEAPCARFIVLREDKSGEVIAFMLCFELGAKLINKFVGMDYGRPKEWQLHFRLWDTVVDYALSRGVHAVQSGQTGYAAKIETGHRLVPLASFCRHRNPIVHKLAAMAARRIDWASLDDDLARHVRAHPEVISR